MAIAFELVINYGADTSSAAAACRLTADYAPLKAGDHQVRLHDPLLSSVRGYDGTPYLEMSIIPVGVGWGVGLDRGQEKIRLSAAALSELGGGLYKLLTQFTGYRAAAVGWDPEGHVDLAELREEWAEELATGQMPGLVLAEDLRHELSSPSFTPFAPGFVWIPYRGERPSSLTTNGRKTEAQAKSNPHGNGT